MTTTITVQQMHKFLSRHYKRERLEGRNGAAWGHDYSTVVATSHLGDLNKSGVGYISKHESIAGEAMKYTAADVAREAP